MSRVPQPPLFLITCIMLFALSSSQAQESRGPFSFGIEFGQVSGVHMAYTVIQNLDISVSIGSPISSTVGEKPEHLGASVQYRFGTDNPVIMLRPSVYSLSGRSYDMAAGSDFGVLYDLNESVSTKAFLGLYVASGSGKGFGELVPSVGVGVMIHLP